MVPVGIQQFQLLQLTNIKVRIVAVPIGVLEKTGVVTIVVHIDPLHVVPVASRGDPHWISVLIRIDRRIWIPADTQTDECLSRQRGLTDQREATVPCLVVTRGIIRIDRADRIEWLRIRTCRVESIGTKVVGSVRIAHHHPRIAPGWN